VQLSFRLTLIGIVRELEALLNQNGIENTSKDGQNGGKTT
jgi:hypothetical protein